MSKIIQMEAERCIVLTEIVGELGGLAHQDMTAMELDKIVDNMLSKGVPNDLSTNLQRWIHTHRTNPECKIAQILGAHVTKTSSIIPECFGKFFDAQAVECKACLDRTMCKMKSNSRSLDDNTPVNPQYLVGNIAPNAQNIVAVIAGKTGQMAKTLSHGNKVVLMVEDNKLKVLSMDSNNPDKENTMVATKGAPKKVSKVVEEEEEVVTKKTAPAKKAAAKAAAVVEEEDDDLELEADEEELEEELDEEEAEEEEGEEVADDEEEEVPAKVKKAVKVKKEPKAKPVLNKAQQDFQDELDKRSGEDKQKFSATIAKKLGLKLDEKGDARIDHMIRTMAIKKHLGTIGGKKK